MNTKDILLARDLSFDELVLIAAADADRFEAVRAALIERVINMPGANTTQLMALQNRLNQNKDEATPDYVHFMRLSSWLDEPYRQLTQKLCDSRLQYQGSASLCSSVDD